MQYMYAYKSSDGVRHEDTIEAESRESVFETLRAQGIRPIKVVAMDGSRANGEVVRPWRRMWLVWAALAGALGATVLIVALSGVRKPRGATPPTDKEPGEEVQIVRPVKQGERVAKPRARRQVGIGAITATMPLDAIFSHPSEVLLARFAEPGRVVEVDVSVDAELAEEFRDALEDPIIITADDSAEIAELKCIVAGLKEEAKMMMASGRTFEDAIAYFMAQQEMEARYRDTILSRDASVEEKNKLLSAIGLQTIEHSEDE